MNLANLLGPHGGFILGSYLVLALAIVIELALLRRRRRAADELAGQARRTARRYGRSTRFEEHA